MSLRIPTFSFDHRWGSLTDAHPNLLLGNIIGQAMRNILLALILGTVESEAVAAKPSAFLKDAYRDSFLMGTAVNEEIVAGKDKASVEIVQRHFNTITAENVMKTESINPQPGVYNFGPADSFVEFGEKHGMFVVGHTLVWHNQTPAW